MEAGKELRRRMETEAKAKVQLVVLPRSIWKKRINSTFSSKSTEAKQLARQGIESILPNKTDATTFAFASVSILLLWRRVTVRRKRQGSGFRGLLYPDSKCGLRSINPGLSFLAGSAFNEYGFETLPPTF